MTAQKQCNCACVAAARDDDPSGSLAWLERKIQDVTLLPASHGEVRLSKGWGMRTGGLRSRGA